MGHKGPFDAVLGHFGTITEISDKTVFGDQLNGLGTS